MADTSSGDYGIDRTMNQQTNMNPIHLLQVAVILAVTWLISVLPAYGAPDSAVTIVAEEYRFTGPDRIAGGWNLITLENRGRDTHHVQFLKLAIGKTAKEFREVLAADSTQLPSWVTRYGGVNGVMPGDEASVMIDLDPGEYILICGIPDEHGRPHVIHGMSKTLSVGEREAERLASPSHTHVLSMKEFTYTFDKPITAGNQTILVRNEGEQAHEVLILALEPGASVMDFLDFFRPGIPRNPAGRTIGGVTGLAPGRQAFLPLQAEPGRYGILCFLADPILRRPHFMEGMWLDIDVLSITSPKTP